jgi:rsbT co-antagonist protein RsbR
MTETGVSTEAAEASGSAQAGNVLDAAALRRIYEIEDDVLAEIGSCQELMAPLIPGVIGSFYDWLEKLPVYEQFFSDKELLESVQNRIIEYWQVFFQAEVDDAYVASRRFVGETHARIGLDLNSYFGGMSVILARLSDRLRDENGAGTKSAAKVKAAAASTQAVTRLAFFDSAIVVDEYSRRSEEELTRLSRSMMEMSTPVTQIWDEILLLPIVGLIDSKRAQDIMGAMLSKISETQSRVFILDISGVGVVDTAVANHLIKITRATRLMGCECTVSGVSPAIAQTIVELGIDVTGVSTTANMQDALVGAFKQLGVGLRRASA